MVTAPWERPGSGKGQATWPPGETPASEAGGCLGWAGPSTCVLGGGHQKQPAADLPYPWMDGLPRCVWWGLKGNGRERVR